MEFFLNGRPVSVEVRDGPSLLEVLREQCGLTSMKNGCAPEGSCGASTVLVDGRAVVSCAHSADCIAGRQVTTIEGLSDAHRELWAKSFITAGAVQCGFCTPGVVIKAEGLLRRTPALSRADIARALAGHLCRCTGYVKIIDAIRLTAAARRGKSSPNPTPAVGSERARPGSRAASWSWG